MVYTNNSVVPITEIGTTSNTGLQCITDRRPCCGTPPDRLGQWYFPNGTTVPIAGGSTTFYRTRGDDGTVNLNQPSGVMSPTGLFCCEVPNAAGVTQRVVYNHWTGMVESSIQQKRSQFGAILVPCIEG